MTYLTYVTWTTNIGIVFHPVCIFFDFIPLTIMGIYLIAVSINKYTALKKVA